MRGLEFFTAPAEKLDPKKEPGCYGQKSPVVSGPPGSGMKWPVVEAKSGFRVVKWLEKARRTAVEKRK